jgi:ABC-type cobalt transport system substrate-binding protein
MGLLWTFMGASLAYNVFTGIAEMLGGALLTMRRTTLLGALISAGVMANIVMLNFSYDVPVKLYSSHLLAMAIFLALPDARRLFDFFVRNRPVEPARVEAVFDSRRGHRAALVLRTLFVLAITLLPLSMSYEQRQQFLQRGESAIWNVTSFTGAGEPWQRVVFEPRSELSVFAGSSRQRYRFERQGASQTIRIRRRENPNESYVFTYTEGAAEMTLNGMYRGHDVKVALAKAPRPQFPLLTRGFHWVNEYPYNR